LVELLKNLTQTVVISVFAAAGSAGAVAVAAGVVEVPDDGALDGPEDEPAPPPLLPPPHAAASRATTAKAAARCVFFRGEVFM
jgi:hypothetical protein